MTRALLIIAAVLIGVSTGHAQSNQNARERMSELWQCLLEHGSSCVSPVIQEAPPPQRVNVCDPVAAAQRLEQQNPGAEPAVLLGATRIVLELYGCIAPRPASPQTTTTCLPFGDGFQCTTR